MSSARTVRMVSLGCAKNLVDSEVMLGLLQKRGWVPTAEEEAEVVIINTCAFIRQAKEESIEAILAEAAAKERGRCRRLVVAGCLPQRYGRELPAGLPEVDLFVGTGEMQRIADLLQAAPPEAPARRSVVRPPTYLYDHRTPRVHTSSPGSAYLKIAEGCSNRCSYCVIPAIRGKLRSRKIASVVHEARQAVARGAKEINLIAQDTTAYGRDLGPGVDLEKLLAELVKVPGLSWIRLLYAHPAHVTPALIRLLREEEKICKYLDLPLQHIDGALLKAMNRPVSEDGVRLLLARLREEIPGIALRTSLMVGFPGETERRFCKLLAFVREAQFERLGVFPYSREEGTPAAARKGQVPERLKEERRLRIMALQKRIARRKQESLVGSRIPVLIERPGNSPGVLWEGRTQGQAPEVDGLTFITRGEARPGEIYPVKITAATAYDLYGEIAVPAPSFLSSSLTRPRKPR